MRKSNITCFIFLTVSLISYIHCEGQKADTAKTSSRKDTSHSAQVGASDEVVPAFKISGYVDAYYALYSDSVGTGNYQKFPAISPRSNSFGLNIAQVTEQYTSTNIRSTATFQFGDLPSAAWSPVFNFVQEANVGVRLCKGFWVDAGFFKTHIGTESLLPRDNICSSVSVITFYEPWWQSGVEFSYSPSDKFKAGIFIENGYNEFVANNNKKSLGMLFTYALGTKASLGYYNFIGDGTPDNITASHLRFLNNFVFNYQPGKKFKMILGVDYISQQHSSLSDSTKSAFAYSGILTLNYKFTPKWGIYYRVESFSDADGFITGTIIDTKNNRTGYILTGFTLGLEFKPTESSFIRLEGRDIAMDQRQEIFYTNGTYTNTRFEGMMDMGVSF